MTRHNTGSRPPYDFAGGVIRIEADALARRHGLEPERVRRILERTATDAYGRPIQPPAPGRDNLSEGLQFHPSLEEALAFLPREQALSAFEQTDPITLSKRAQLIPYLADLTSPSYSALELADLLDAYGLHLDRNRNSLIRTGFPETRFAPSPWLDWHLTLVSPTKIPINAVALPDPTHSGDLDRYTAPFHQDTLSQHEVNTDLMYSYAWSRESVPPMWTKNGPFLVRSLEQRLPFESCRYEQAALMAGLSPEVAVQLERGRTKLFDVKEKIVSACARCLRTGDSEMLWQNVLDVLIDSLLWQDARRCLEVEEIYWQAGIAECVVPSFWLRAPDEVPGTLSALLTLAGHVEKELRIGTFNATISGMKRVLAGASLVTIESYFQIVGRPDQAAVDAVLDGFWSLEVQERPFWNEFRRRINEAIETELREEVIVRVPVRRGLAAKFEPYLRTFAEWQHAHLEATGTLVPLDLSPSSNAAPRPNVFRREGQIWTVQYEGKLVHLQDVRGMRYLAVLLAHPNREFHVLELVRLVMGTAADPNPSQASRDREALAGLQQSDWGFGDAGQMIDDPTRSDVEQRLKEILVEIDEKLELGDADGADQLRTEQEMIVQYLAATLGLGKRPRAAASTVDRTRTSVTKRISDARKRIAEHHPALALHLRAIKTGTYCTYAPDVPVSWDM
jgi:hypothetical protein